MKTYLMTLIGFISMWGGLQLTIASSERNLMKSVATEYDLHTSSPKEVNSLDDKVLTNTPKPIASTGSSELNEAGSSAPSNYSAARIDNNVEYYPYIEHSHE
ncbi:hypothetical protein [Vibrio marisflavi]|uniref:Uncharacterized protein n=1 Tax=Vibrio marisflavi CECT 7928 TaxID=634439 RepID=A0ABM9A316_9VIBR|nr:hypothetical protein [Vibrio marisflavi]CAH0538917.1 hypothetical protein VMF7928_01755 [Vibrio marisflavi CECT 7928]